MGIGSKELGFRGLKVKFIKRSGFGVQGSEFRVQVLGEF